MGFFNLKYYIISLNKNNNFEFLSIMINFIAWSQIIDLDHNKVSLDCFAPEWQIWSKFYGYGNFQTYLFDNLIKGFPGCKLIFENPSFHQAQVPRGFDDKVSHPCDWRIDMDSWRFKVDHWISLFDLVSQQGPAAEPSLCWAESIEPKTRTYLLARDADTLNYLCVKIIFKFK